MQDHPRTGYFVSIGAALCWALTGPGVKFVQDNFALAPIALAFWRVVITSMTLLLGLWLVRPDLLRVNREQLKLLLFSGVIGIGIYQTAFVYSIKLNGAAIGIVLVYVYPVFVALGSYLFLKERLTGYQLIAMLISLLGCALIVQLYDPTALLQNPLGALVGLASALLQALYTLLSRQLALTTGANTHPITTLTYTFVFGGCTLLLIALLSARQPVFIQMNWSAIPAITVLALGPTMTGYALFNWALSKLSGRIVSLIVIAEVPLAALIGVFFLHESLSVMQVVGIALVLVGIAFPSLKSK